MLSRDLRCVPKACAYVTRGGCDQLLVFQGPDHEGWQVPKGTIEPGESPRRAVVREVTEESGLAEFEGVGPLASDVWTRRPGVKKYARFFYHVRVDEDRDEWVHEVTDGGAEDGYRFRYEWAPLPTDREFVLDLDDYLDRLRARGPRP